MKPFLLAAIIVLGGAAHAQVDLPVFGAQHVINGYAKDIEGEVLSYFSVYPEHATTALLTRCTDGKKTIAWETAAVPKDMKGDYAYFSWIAAHNSTTSGGGSILRPLHQRHEGAHLHHPPQPQARFMERCQSG